ncbi:NepR family anti-sigma factor [Yoonia sp. R2331]|uniref:NepR family anti-sigma factor n=1 Tax=Yoonia sp. R2331 TaxID=3237238 RepID=UPI0034E4D2ED
MSKDQPSETAKALIDANLRRVFSEAAEEELPERFHELLAQLKTRASPQDDGPQK